MTHTKLALQSHAAQTGTDARAVESHVSRLLMWPHWPVNLEDITASHINRFAFAAKHDLNLSPSTIGTRLSVLKKAMQRAGVTWPIDVKMPQRSKRPKWVIPVKYQADLLNALIHGHDVLRTWPEAERKLMVDYIVFVTETGLRVEEALRARGRHLLYVGTGEDVLSAGADAIYGNKATLEVMGTKTVGSYDLIPLSKTAVEVIESRRKDVGDELLFDITYENLRDLWNDCLKVLGVTDDTATLKSLRRTFATRLAARGIPTTLLQKLMRHASLVTTSQYTNTIGLHEAARQWLS